MLADELIPGLTFPDRAGRPILYRYVRTGDSRAEITSLLHAAYSALAAAGMRFHASHQNEATTQERIDRGETIVALDGPRLIGIITLAEIAATDGSPFYDRADVASFGQFGVLPEFQSAGIGGKLLALVESRAKEKGIGYLALDTAETASYLIAWYSAQGFQFVEHVQWEVTNYRSVVMAKSLVG